MEDHNGKFLIEHVKFVFLLGSLHLLRIIIILVIISIEEPVPPINSRIPVDATSNVNIPIIVIIVSEFLSGILILMKKQMALIIYLPFLFFNSFSIIVVIGQMFIFPNSLTLVDFSRLILSGSWLVEGIVCMYLGILWMNYRWLSDKFESDSTD